MAFPTLTQKNEAFSALRLPNVFSQHVASTITDDPKDVHNLVLDQALGRDFRNPEVQVRVSGPKQPVEIITTGRFSNFMGMTGLRNNTQANTDNWKFDREGQLTQLESKQGLALSNVGVSLALTVEHSGKEYAVLITRNVEDEQGQPKIRLMLPSGYVDAAKLFNNQKFAAFDPETPHRIRGRTLFLANAMYEGAEEILGAQAPGWFGLSEFSRGTLSQDVLGELAFLHNGHIKRFGHDDVLLSGAYDELSYSDDILQRMTFTELPAHVTNVFPSQQVIIDGQPLPGAGFQIHEHTNSGQIILGGRLTLPSFATEETAALFSLLHAEDGPGNLDGQPKDLLATKVNAFGMIMCELDPNTKQLTSNFSNFILGSLIPALHLGGIDNLMVSDAFVEREDSWTGKGGFLNTPHVSLSKYLGR